MKIFNITCNDNYLKIISEYVDIFCFQTTADHSNWNDSKWKCGKGEMIVSIMSVSELERWHRTEREPAEGLSCRNDTNTSHGTSYFQQQCHRVSCRDEDRSDEFCLGSIRWRITSSVRNSALSPHTCLAPRSLSNSKAHLLHGSNSGPLPVL